MSERDMHFQGFAKLLYKEIRNDLSNALVPNLTPRQEQRMKQWIQQLIAQRAYDLVLYSQQFMPGIENVPDIQTWDDIPEGSS